MTLEEIRQDAATHKDFLWESAGAFGRDPKLYLHWTAGGYSQLFSDYHYCITGDGTIHKMRDLTETLSATYMRNTGSISIALCCAYNATPDDLENPPTEEQVEAMAQMTAALARGLGVFIDIEHVMTHAEAADNLDGFYASDPYGPSNGCERWDLAILEPGDEWMSGGDTLRGKAIFYDNQGV